MGIASAQTDWRQSLASIRAELAKIKVVRADFVQEKHLLILTAPLISHGQMRFQSPNRLRWEYTNPIKEVLLVNGNQGATYRWQVDHFEKEPSFSQEISKSIAQGISRWLRGDFESNKVFRVTHIAGSEPHIRLNPTRKEMQRIVREIRIYPAKNVGSLNRVRWTSSNDDHTTWRFKNQRTNVEANSRWFTKP